jgi:hypothetical protein
MSLFFLIPGIGGPKVNLSGEATVTDASVSRACTAGIRVNSDGTIDKLINATYTQISAATDWIIPNGAASSDYDVRITGVTFNTGTVWDSEASPEDVWINLGSDRLWSVDDDSSTAVDNHDVSFTIEIRGPGGTTLSSGAYRIEALYDTS